MADKSGDGGRRTPVELWVGGTAVVLLGLLCLLVLRPFISAALWAVVLCFTTWPLFLRLEMLLGGRRTLSALIATVLLTAIIVGPVVILGATLADNVSALIAASQKLIEEGPPSPPDWVAGIPLIGSHVAAYWNYLNEGSSVRLHELGRLLPAARTVAVWGGGALAEGIFQIGLSILIAFFFYRDGHAAANQLQEALHRIAGERGDRLLELAGATIRAVVYGVLGTALLQGVVAAIGFAIAGVPGAVSLGFITFVLSFLPGGPAIVAAPAAFWLYRQGSIGWAVFMMAWGLMVAMLDNVVKPLLISRGGSTPMILVMLGVLGGALAFGVIGMFLGPTLVALGYSLFEQWAVSAGGARQT
ncbi:MAG: AI-2E family transporter [Candidatus Binatus sp.]|uniref:AI-2E family transporter n=1 Tax=Candidatus Binatus sp. TaxID=2811406 RepID=UPI003C7643BE